MKIEKTQKEPNKYFAGKLGTHIVTPKGAECNGPDAQAVRFERLVQVIDPSHQFSIYQKKASK